MGKNCGGSLIFDRTAPIAFVSDFNGSDMEAGNGYAHLPESAGRAQSACIGSLAAACLGRNRHV